MNEEIHTMGGDWECRSFNEVNCMESSGMVYSWIEKWNGTTKVSSDVEQITTLFCFIPSADSSQRFETVGVETLSPPSPRVCPVMMRNPAKGSGCSTSKSLAGQTALNSAWVLTLCQLWHHNSAHCDGHLINGIINCWQNNLWCIMLPMGCTAYQIK